MKKFVAIVVTLMMILAMGCAFALDWSNVKVQAAGCDKYNVVLYKLERVEGINGDFKSCTRSIPIRRITDLTHIFWKGNDMISLIR